ncbi:1-aminocyclopropane-1-carboxylate deaminase/D-cysteine desulfhydrase [Bacterioplanoides sp.]|uniref:1-aminocyclopropane-1-carboxylate deaminase/D-cysteine desulfhydrase n=1 Tax=Bacterioplanoides sp. TaxID=2066072 RepID=UPI003AFF8B63
MQSSFTQRFPHLFDTESSVNRAADKSSPIASLPTPVGSLPELGEQAFVKYDNLTHPEYGGNKIRKLDWIAADIRKNKARHVITFGAIGTNAGVATAMMCQRLGVRCSIYLFDQPLSNTVYANIKRMQGYGAELIYCGSLFNTMLRFYSSVYRLKPYCYFLWAGCSNPPAILAYVDAAFELQQQVQQGLIPEPKKIVIPVGSGSSAAGLYLGLQLTGLSSELIPVRVAPSKLGPFDACSDAIINRQIKTGAELLKLGSRSTPRSTPQPLPHSLPQSKLNHDYYGEGYGHADEQVKHAISTFAQSGIQLEGTYSGKAACAFLDCLKRSSGPVLFWNTYNSSAYIPEPAISVLPNALKKKLEASELLS